MIFLCKILSKYPNKIFCNSQKSINQHIKYGYSNNFELIKNGLKINKFKIDNILGNKFRIKHNIAEGEYCIGLIARYHPMKDHNFFVQNVSEVLSDNVRVIIVGKNVLNKKNEILKSAPKNFHIDFY